MKEIVIDVKKVSKKYKKSETLALSDITFQVEKGAIAAFLGPNGAGKSTMIKLFWVLSGLQRAIAACWEGIRRSWILLSIVKLAFLWEEKQI